MKWGVEERDGEGKDRRDDDNPRCENHAGSKTFE